MHFLAPIWFTALKCHHTTCAWLYVVRRFAFVIPPLNFFQLFTIYLNFSYICKGFSYICKGLNPLRRQIQPATRRISIQNPHSNPKPCQFFKKIQHPTELQFFSQIQNHHRNRVFQNCHQGRVQFVEPERASAQTGFQGAIFHFSCFGEISVIKSPSYLALHV